MKPPLFGCGMQKITMKISIVIFIALTCMPHSLAAEMILFEQKACPWCERWEEEIGRIYNDTNEGKQAPVRRVDIHQPLPPDLIWLKTGVFTPTFVVIDKNKEIGRIRGYPGDSFFWGLLSQILDKLPKTDNKDG